MTSEAPTSSKSPGNSLPSAAKTTNKHGNTFLNSKKIRKAVDHFYEHGFRTRKLKQHFPLSLVNPHNSKITPTLILEDAGLEITGNNHRWARQSVLRELRKRPCKIGEEDEKALMESGLDGSEVAKTVRSAVKRFCVFGFVTSEFRDKYAAKTDGGDPSAEDILKDASLTFPESLSGFLSSWVVTCLSVNKRNKENGSTDRKDSPPVKENNLKKGSTPKGKAMKKKAKKAVGPASAVNQQNSTSKKSEKTSKNPPSDKTLEPKKREVSEYKPVQSQKPASALQGQSQGPKVEDALGTGSQNSQKAPMSWGQNFYNGSAVGNENRGYPWFGNKSDYISHFNNCSYENYPSNYNHPIYPSHPQFYFSRNDYQRGSSNDANFRPQNNSRTFSQTNNRTFSNNDHQTFPNNGHRTFSHMDNRTFSHNHNRFQWQAPPPNAASSTSAAQFSRGGGVGQTYPRRPGFRGDWRPQTPAPPEVSTEVKEEIAQAKRREEENQRQAAKEEAAKAETRTKVEMLKERLKKRKEEKLREGGTTEEEEEEEVDENDDGHTKGPAQDAIHARPVDDMFMSSEDYRAIGSGQIEVSTGAASSADLGNGSPSAGMGSATEVSGFVDPVEHYLRKANEKSGAKDSSSSSSNVVRVANKAGWMDLSWWKNKAKQARELEEKRQRKQMLLKRQRTLSENISEQNSSKRSKLCNEETEAETKRRREEFSRMTQKLKTTIMLKDKDFLQELIDSPNVMKRKLMSKLVLERQDQISSELTRLRMRPVQSNSGGFGDSPGTDDAAGIIEELENDSKIFAEVDFSSLPDLLVRQMEDMIKKVSEKKLGVTNKASETVKGREERSDVVITRKPVVSMSASSDLSKPNPSEDPDIVEVPVPPKPPAPVITLDMEDDNGEEKEKEGSPSLPISDLGCSNETAPTPAGPGANHHSTSNELPVWMTELPRGSNETAPTLAGPGANDHSTSDDLPVWMTELLRGSAVSLSIAKTTEADVGERAEKEASANSQKPQDKFQVLKVLSERENDLYKELDEMEARRREIRETLEYLRNLRNETIASGLAKTD